jgi:uncharacterized membrane protein YdbT with pleckstrin-like domain
VLQKTGVVSRRSLDIPLAKVESVDLRQGVLGRLLGYGTLVIGGTGGTRQRFRNVYDPHAFRLYLQDQIQLSREEVAQTLAPTLTERVERVERECPYCAERILAKARVCKHCGRDVEPVSESAGKP